MVKEMKVKVSVFATVPMTIFVDDSDDLDERIASEFDTVDTGDLQNVTWDVEDVSQESIIRR